MPSDRALRPRNRRPNAIYLSDRIAQHALNDYSYITLVYSHHEDQTLGIFRYSYVLTRHECINHYTGEPILVTYIVTPYRPFGPPLASFLALSDHYRPAYILFNRHISRLHA